MNECFEICKHAQWLLLLEIEGVLSRKYGRSFTVIKELIGLRARVNIWVECSQQPWNSTDHRIYSFFPVFNWLEFKKSKVSVWSVQSSVTEAGWCQQHKRWGWTVLIKCVSFVTWLGMYFTQSVDTFQMLN